MYQNPRIMVLGYAGHGKDSVCEILRKNYGLQFQSSSYFVAERAVRPHMAAKGIVYENFDAMYADRVNHRSDWYDAIAEYNRVDPTKLGRELYENYNIYCGIRNRCELIALQKLKIVQFTFWVDASERHSPERPTSISVGPEDTNYIIDNNGAYELLEDKVANAYSIFVCSGKMNK